VEEEGVDSGFDSDYTDERMSITSSMYEYRYGKRRYHGVLGNPYPFPNDRLEMERLDELQCCMHALIGTNIVAPIGRKPTQIVDVGTGTGAWVIEVADCYGTAVVSGTDISPIQPTSVPPNSEFIAMDLNDGLEFDDGSTDLVHSRYLHAGLTVSQWPTYLQEILRILKPNDGWAQMIELGYPYVLSDNSTLPEDAPLSKLSGYIQKHYRENLQMLLHGGELERLMIEAGFVDVKPRKIKIELGDWGLDPTKHNVARRLAIVWTAAMVALGEQMTMFIPDEELSEFLEDVKRDIGNKDYHLYADMYLVIGRKPDVTMNVGKTD